MGEVEKNNFIVLLGKGGHSMLVPLKTVCLNPEGFSEEFYRNDSRQYLLIKVRVCAGPALLNLASGDELLWYSRLSNCDLHSRMKKLHQVVHLPFVEGLSST